MHYKNKEYKKVKRKKVTKMHIFAGDGIRTHAGLRPVELESTALTNSATPALYTPLYLVVF